jgi:hypothetical protein
VSAPPDLGQVGQPEAGGGCTNCGKKGGCDHRKGAMFAAIEAALARLYPTRRFGERREPDAESDLARQPSSPGLLAKQLTKQLGTLVVELPPDPEEYCQHIYVLCLGRQPSLLEMRLGLVDASVPVDIGPEGLDELYLRIAISDLAPFAAVQQVRMKGQPMESEATGDAPIGLPTPGALPTGVLIEETTRAGVFDPVLLPRFQRVVAILVEAGYRNLDFGEINEPPADFDAGEYTQRYGGEPVVANYLFYPQPCSSITTTVVPFSSPANEDDVLSNPAAVVV